MASALERSSQVDKRSNHAGAFRGSSTAQERTEIAGTVQCGQISSVLWKYTP